MQVWQSVTGEDGWTLLHSDKVSDTLTKVAWCDPEHGPLILVGSTHGTVHVLQGPCSTSRRWQWVGRLQCGKASITDLKFAPTQFGLLVAASSRDGHVYMYEAASDTYTARQHDDGGLTEGQSCFSWSLQSKLKAVGSNGKDSSCGCLCWRPFTAGIPPIIVTGSREGAVAWCYNQSTMSWKEAGRFRHDVGCAAIAVDWAPTLGRPYDLVAVSFGATVTVFKVTGTPTKLDIDVVSQLRNPSSVWRIEFSLTTSTLACSLSDPAEIWLWMPSFSGSWRPVSRIVSGKGC
eukprot:jgi/Chrzof1/14549/Cz09g07010.t1